MLQGLNLSIDSIQKAFQTYPPDSPSLVSILHLCTSVNTDTVRSFYHIHLHVGWKRQKVRRGTSYSMAKPMKKKTGTAISYRCQLPLLVLNELFIITIDSHLWVLIKQNKIIFRHITPDCIMNFGPSIYTL